MTGDELAEVIASVPERPVRTATRSQPGERCPRVRSIQVHPGVLVGVAAIAVYTGREVMEPPTTEIDTSTPNMLVVATGTVADVDIVRVDAAWETSR